MPIIDPLPSGRRLPLMHTVQDAAKLNVQERTTFYVSAYLFQCWLSDLVLANTAQLAEKAAPNARSFQTGEALRGFHKFFGNASDAEFPSVFSGLMEFAACDDPLAEHVCQAAFRLLLLLVLDPRVFYPQFPVSRIAAHGIAEHGTRTTPRSNTP